METPNRKSRDGGHTTPKWVKITVVIALATTVLIAIVMASGLGGAHAPGRHMPPADTVAPQ